MLLLAMAQLTPLVDAQGVSRQNLYRPVMDGLLNMRATDDWQAIDVIGTTWENLESFAIHVYGPTARNSESVLYAVGPTAPTTDNNPDVARNEETQSLIAIGKGDKFWYKRAGGTTNVLFQVLAWY